MNKEIVSLLNETATYLRLTGANDFKAMAYDKAARTIEGMEDFDTLLANQELDGIKGIGKSLTASLYEYADSGSFTKLEELRAEVPTELIKWLDISGLGPKKIYKIHKELEITTLEELQAHCEDGSVAALSGMGKKTAENIIKSIEWMQTYDARCRLDIATVIAESFYQSLKKIKGVQEISIAGSLRRQRETIGDIDILVAAKEAGSSTIFDAFTSQSRVTEVLGKGDTKSSVRTTDGRQVDLRIVDTEAYPAALMYFTGSKEHNVVMRGRARDRGMGLNEYGLFKLDKEGNTDFDAPVKTKSEADIYAKLDLGFVPPELREDQGEFSYFESEKEAVLLENKDLKGVLHAHSTWSDGQHSIEEMARACIERGYEYLGLTDHSQTAAYAGGLTPDQVKAQWEEIDALNQKLEAEGLSFQVLKGIESDILQDGSLDYDDALLEGFDLVIGSVHASLDMDPKKMLARVKKAIEHPCCSMIGHPTGRLLLKREANPYDLNALIEHAAAHNTAIEINASPWRLDIDWHYGAKLRATGCMSAINPDAHATDQIDVMRYGVSQARKGRLGPTQILNTKSLADLNAWLASPRSLEV